MTSDELIRSFVAELRPVRRLTGSGIRALRWAVSAAVCVSIGVYLFGFRSDLSIQLRDPRYLRENACLALVFAFAAASAFELSIPRLARDSRGQLAALSGLLVWFAQVAVVRSSAPDGPIAHAAFWVSALACMQRTAWLALAPMLGMFWMLRRAAPLDRGWAGSFAALSAASLATLGTQAICANDERWHVVLWHFGPVLVATVAGSALGRLLFGRMAAPSAS